MSAIIDGDLRARTTRARWPACECVRRCSDPHRRGRRRLDPALRRRPASSRTRFRRRRSGASLLSARGSAHRHRCERDDRQARSPIISRTSSGPAMTRRSTAKPSRKAFKALARKIGDGKSPEEVAEGAIRIAVGNMANAIKTISVQRGHDVTEYVLNGFGGAGGQHACHVADALGIGSVLIHPLSGVLSAYGIGLASISAMRSKAVLAPLDEDGLGALAAIRAPLEVDARQELARPGSRAERRHRDRLGASSLCRHRFKLPDPGGELAGYAGSVRDRASATLRLRQSGQGDRDRGGRGRRPKAAACGHASLSFRSSTRRSNRRPAPRMFTHGAWHEAPVLLRASLKPGQSIAGPGPDHRGPPDGRGRAGLAGASDREEPSLAQPHRETARRAARRQARRSRAA